MPIIVVWEPGSLGHYRETLKIWARRLVRSRIFNAVERGDRSLVLKLASARTLARARNEFGNRPLVACIVAKQSQIACDLVDRGAFVEGDGGVAQAVMWKDLSALQKLIEVGANLEEPLPEGSAQSGWTPLMWATNRHNFEAMKMLLAAGAQINSVARDGTTAVMCTSAGRDDDLIALDILCSYKPKLAVKDWRGRTILDEANDRARFSNKTAMRDILQRHFPELVGHET